MKPICFFVLFIVGFTIHTQEICNNAIDDDGDGLIDLFDDDCDCSGFNNSSNVPSLIPNHSFEDRNCCPTSFSQLTCAQNWVQATSATSDYFNCNYNFGAFTNLGLSIPNGTGYVGAIFSKGWQEYVGSCLLQPLLAGEKYQLSFNIAHSLINGLGGVCSGSLGSDVDITIFGSTNCSNLPVATQSCPTPAQGWEVIGSINYNPQNTWSVLTIDINPNQNINAIMIGSPCTLPNDYGGGCYKYFYFDNLILNKTDVFASVDIEASGHLCSDNLVLTAIKDTNAGTLQWYKDSIALVGEIGNLLNVSANNYGTGNYSVRLEIGNLCEVVSLEVLPTILTFNAVGDSTCKNENNGTILVNNIGGNGTAPYQYQINNQAYINTSTINNLAHGQYWVKVKDSNQCVDSNLVTIVGNDVPIVDFLADEVCIGNNTTLTDQSSISNGTMRWEWLIDNQIYNIQNVNHQFNSIYGNTAKLKVYSNHGCVDSVIKNIVIYPLPKANFTFADNICQYEPVNFINTSTLEGNPYNNSFSFQWDLADGNMVSTTDVIHNYQLSDSFDVRLVAISGDGCLHDTTFTINIPPKPQADFLSDSVCLGLITSLTDISNIINGNITNWEWSNAAVSQNTTHQFSKAGSNSMTLIITSDFNCKDTITKNIEVHHLPKADFTFNKRIIDYFNNEVSFENTSIGAVDYEWLFDNNFTSNEINPIHSFDVDTPCINYNARLIAFTEFDCVDTITKEINSIGYLTNYIPNAFTPDGDNINDIFKPVVTDFDVLNYMLTIYDRWGNIIFETTDFNEGWDGTMDGQPLPNGTYIWKIRAKEICSNKTAENYIGHLLLIR